MGQSGNAINGLLKATVEVPKEAVIKPLGDPQTVKLGEAVQLAKGALFSHEGPASYRSRIDETDGSSSQTGS
ncbi:hypothetical protein [Streptomyces vinaceus]|uniref:hypothetical protein n=1 Tax=Streptomyces vinaceus TaxID=1960 RepID=UPI003820DFBB